MCSHAGPHSPPPPPTTPIFLLSRQGLPKSTGTRECMCVCRQDCEVLVTGSSSPNHSSEPRCTSVGPATMSVAGSELLAAPAPASAPAATTLTRPARTKCATWATCRCRASRLAALLHSTVKWMSLRLSVPQRPGEGEGQGGGGSAQLVKGAATWSAVDGLHPPTLHMHVPPTTTSRHTLTLHPPTLHMHVPSTTSETN